ncbi:flagellar basal body P-ring formation chaperone FlgA [Glaciecola sp. SC05]|uniref:flagellar basal body P-ring formation chaperone FlgA n=1 Tax=Glaciecola sp. SC05 TaxID=1987355 RepID=UPI003528129B
MHYKKHIYVSTIFSIVFALFFVSLAAVAQTSPHATIQSQTEDFVRYSLFESNTGNTDIKVREIDPRIAVPNCPEGFDFESPNFDSRLSNVSVKVSCPSLQWFVFTNVSIQSLQQVVITTDTLSPGALLSSRNIEIADIDKSKIRGSTFSTIKDINGARVKRRLRPGTVLSSAMLCFVCKGDRVTISAVAGGLSIQVYGIAEEDGTLGETIQVRNMSSDKMVFATVAGTEEVTIKI